MISSKDLGDFLSILQQKCSDSDLELVILKASDVWTYLLQPPAGRASLGLHNSDKRRTGAKMGRPTTRSGSLSTTNSIFFCFLFVKNIIDLPGWQINDPMSGKHYSLPFR